MEIIIDEISYKISYNIVEQVNKDTTIEYNNAYLFKYDKFDSLIDNIRASLIQRFDSKSVLDFGCGNASLIKLLSSRGIDVYGHDIVNYSNPFYTDNFTHKVDTVCFFDSLEHLKNPSEVISQLNCNNLIISLPWCKFPITIDWFKNWKHRRPNEHFWYFNPDSLEALVKPYGFKMEFYGNYEDVVRVDKNNNPNILTCGFSRSSVV